MALSLARLLNSPLAHGFALTFARPVYRTIFLVLLALGTNAGIFLSYTSLWARTVLDATPGLASVLFLAYGLAGSVGNTLLGIWSDRLRRRVPLIVGSTATASLAVASMAFIPSFPLAVVACALAGVNAFSPTLALASDHVRHDASLPSATAPVVIATERMAWSLGILIGPAIAAALLALTASFPSLYLTGALCIASGTLLALHLEDAPGTTGAPVHHGPARRALPSLGLAGRRRREDVALGLLFTALVLLFSAAWARNIFVPLQVTEAFGLPATAVGPAFTATAVAATLLMPTLGQITPRVGTTAVLLLGALLGIGYCTVEALLQSYPLLLLNQTLLGAGIAIWTVGGLLMAQEIAPDRAGTASATYVGAAQLAPVVSAVLLGGVAEVAGIRGAFLFGAGLGLLAATLIGLLARLKPR